MCYAVIDLGKQRNGGTYPPKWRVLFCFELSKRIEEGPDAGRRFGVFRLYTNSSHEKSALIRDLTGWLGRVPKPGEDLEGVCVGRGACLNIRYRESKDGSRTYADIAAVNPPLDGFESWNPDNGKVNPEWRFPRFASRMRSEALEKAEDFPCDWDQLEQPADVAEAAPGNDMPPF